jgi:hypothetical protein
MCSVCMFLWNALGQLYFYEFGHDTLNEQLVAVNKLTLNLT